MQPMPLKPGDVLQLSEAAPYPYSFLTVLTDKPGGAEGVVLLPEKRGMAPLQTRLFVAFSQAEFIGTAAWIGGAAEPNRRTITAGSRLEIGDVVQLAPSEDGFFGTCYMVVTEPKSFGAQGYISMPNEPGEPPGLAFYRAKWEEMEWIGRAVWMIAQEEVTDGA
jgi:hypothetical protein